MANGGKTRVRGSGNLLEWTLRDVWALAALLAFWLYKSSAIIADVSQRHFAMRLTIPDLLEQQWAMFWLGRVASGDSARVHYSNLLNFPIGADYFGASPNYMHCFMGGVLRSWGTGVAAANAVALGAVLFSLVAFYVLFRRMARSRLIGFVVTIMVASFSLLFDNQLLDVSLCNAGFFTLSLHFWLRTVERPHWRTAVLAVVMGLMTGVSHLYYLAMLLGIWSLALPFLAVREFRRRTGAKRATYWTVATMIATVLAVGLMLWGPMSAIRAVWTSGGAAARIFPRTFERGEFAFVCLAVAALIGTVWSLRRTASERVWLWFAASLVLLLLSLGDRTLVSSEALSGGRTGSSLLLVKLLNLVPMGWRFTQPDRLVVGTLVCAGVLACILWRGIGRRKWSVFWMKSWGAKALLFSAGLFTVFPMLGAATPLRMPGSFLQITTSGGRPMTSMLEKSVVRDACRTGRKLTPVELAGAGAPVLERYQWLFSPLEYITLPPVPQVLADLAEDPKPWAVMEVGGGAHGLSVYFQTFHGKGVGGYHSPSYLRGNFRKSPLTLAEEEIRYHRSYRSLTAERLQKLNVRYVIRFEGDDPAPSGSWCPNPMEVARALTALSAPHLKLVHEDRIVKVWEVVAPRSD